MHFSLLSGGGPRDGCANRKRHLGPTPQHLQTERRSRVTTANVLSAPSPLACRILWCSCGTIRHAGIWSCCPELGLGDVTKPGRFCTWSLTLDVILGMFRRTQTQLSYLSMAGSPPTMCRLQRHYHWRRRVCVVMRANVTTGLRCVFNRCGFACVWFCAMLFWGSVCGVWLRGAVAPIPCTNTNKDVHEDASA